MDVWFPSLLLLELFRISIILDPLFLELYQLIQAWASLIIALSIPIILLYISFNFFSHEKVFVFLLLFLLLFFQVRNWTCSFFSKDIIFDIIKSQFFTYLNIHSFALFFTNFCRIASKYTTLISKLLIIAIATVIFSINFLSNCSSIMCLCLSLPISHSRQFRKLFQKIILNFAINSLGCCFADSLLYNHRCFTTKLIQLKNKIGLCSFVLLFLTPALEHSEEPSKIS